MEEVAATKITYERIDPLEEESAEVVEMAADESGDTPA